MATIWIQDAAGAHALIDAADRELWVGLRGWRDADAPGPTDFVQVVNGELRGCIPFVALAAGWDLLGWKPGAPPEPVDPTKDPAPAGQPADVPAKQTKAAAGGKSEEK